MNESKMGEFISELRKEKNMTQQSLASILNITNKAVSKWERGLSYPDITLLPVIADTLGVSVAELIAGEKDKTITEEQKKKSNSTLKYLNVINNINRTKLYNILFLVISLLSFIAIFITTLCDIVINKKLTWSIIVLLSIVYPYIILISVLFSKTRKFRNLIVSAIVGVIPFLYLILYNLNNLKYFYTIALPISLVAGLYLFLIYYLFKNTKRRDWLDFGTPWFKSAFIILLASALNIYIKYIVHLSFNIRIMNLDDWISAYSNIAITIVFLIIGVYISKKNR